MYVLARANNYILVKLAGKYEIIHYNIVEYSTHDINKAIKALNIKIKA